MPSIKDQAGDHVYLLGVGGFLAAVISLLVAVSQWPEESLATGDESGNAAVAYLALAIYGLAQMAVFVAVVAWGVRLGVRWSGIADSLLTVATSTQTTSTSGPGAARPPAQAGTGHVGAPPVTRHPKDLRGVEPLGPVADQHAHMDEDGR